VLKISSFPLNFPNIGIFSPKFCVLDKNFPTRTNFSGNFPTAHVMPAATTALVLLWIVAGFWFFFVRLL